MAALTIQQVVRTGLVEALVAAGSGGDSFVNDGKKFFRVKNGHASAARTVTFASQLPAGALPQGAAKADLAVVVAAQTTVDIGPFDPSAFNDNTGNYTTPDMSAGALEKARLEVDLAGAAQPIDAAIPFGACLHPALGAKTLPDGTPAPLRLRGFASKNSWRATPLVPVDVKTEIDTSPTASGAWDGWRPFTPGTHRYWRSRLRVTVTGDGTRSVQLPRLVVTRRKFNKKQEGDVVVNCSPVNVVFPTPFQNPPKVNASLVGYTGTPIVTNVTVTGFTIAGGAAVFPGDPATFAPTVHWQAMGT